MAGAIFGQDRALLGEVGVRSRLTTLVQGTFVQAEGKSRQTMFEHGEALYGNKSVDESCPLTSSLLAVPYLGRR